VAPAYWNKKDKVFKMRWATIPDRLTPRPLGLTNGLMVLLGAVNGDGQRGQIRSADAARQPPQKRPFWNAKKPLPPARAG
jgi:hypothetical protein